MKIKYSNILFSLMILIIVCECNGFRLLKLDDNVYKAVYLIIITGMLFICFMHIDILKICKVFGGFLCYYSSLLILFLLFEYKYITNQYGNLQTAYEYVNYNKCYAFVFLAIPLFYILIVQDNFEDLMSTVMLLVTIALGLMLLHALFYQWYQIEFLNISIYAKKLMRNDRFRMWDLSSLEGLAIIYGMYRIFFVKRKKTRYLIQTIICVAALVYVEQTRMMFIALAASIFIMIIMKPCKTANGILAKCALIVMVGVVSVAWVIPKLISSFNGGGSISYRLIELQFVFNMLHNRGILGMGIISSRLQSYLYYHGVYSSVSLDDIGLIGYMAQTGVWSIVLFIVPMVRMLWILFNLKKDEVYIFLWSIFIYLVITSSTLFVLDSQRILMWPFCLALFEFCNNKYNKKMNV